MLKVDNDIAQQKGVTIENAMNTLSTLVGSNYEISFIKFGRPYKVIVQAGAAIPRITGRYPEAVCEE